MEAEKTIEEVMQREGTCDVFTGADFTLKEQE